MIRDAEPRDLVRIMAFWAPMVRDSMVTFSSEPKGLHDLHAMLEDRRAKGRGFLVAEVDGVVAGFASYDQFRGGNGYAHSMEHTIILDVPARGRGLGRALLNAICDHGAAAGAHVMMAGVSGGNAQGVAFHAACGFTEVARVPQVGRKFDQWWDLVLMQRMLS